MKNYYNCIYMYTNKINGKRYIGQAKDFNKRHKAHLRGKKQIIDRAINKYGIENFDITILACNIETQDKINEYEKFFIKRYKTLETQNGYNIAEGGSNGNPYEGKTQEEIDEIVFKQKETRKINNKPVWNKGLQLSEDHKNKLSETRKEKGLAKGENNPMYGKHHTEEANERNRQAHIGKNSSKHRKIVQYDLEWNFIKIWEDGLRETGKQLGIDSSWLSKCCKTGKTAKGYHWKYLDEIDKE